MPQYKCLENTVVSERRESQKTTYCVTSLMWKAQNRLVCCDSDYVKIGGLRRNSKWLPMAMAVLSEVINMFLKLAVCLHGSVIELFTLNEWGFFVFVFGGPGDWTRASSCWANTLLLSYTSALNEWIVWYMKYISVSWQIACMRAHTWRERKV